MTKHIFRAVGASLAALLWLAPAQAAKPLPHPTTGTIERLQMHSAYVDARLVDVWLPRDYAERTRAGHRYQVLYMQDGQMLFDDATTWNGQSWHIDRTLDALMREGRVPDTIVVGVWNNGKYRAAEYYPQKFLDYLAAPVRDAYLKNFLEGRAQSDNYLRFLVTELKPAIDRRYATRSDAAGTFIMGSSMGGLISVYAMAEYPAVFGGAAGLSTHWVGSFAANASLPLGAFRYLSERLPAPAGRRLYLDRGTATLDALYGPSHDFIDQIVRERGYGATDYMSRVFEGADHSEAAWSARLATPLLFLLRPR